jgi:glucose-6-phosphate dehydrogenase assembly protein OpcA
VAQAVTSGGQAATEEQAVHRRLMRFGEAETLVTPMWEERDTSVRAIASHLATLFDLPAGMDDGGDPLVREKGLPHARASVLNLIVTVVDAEAADRAVQTLMGLGVRHPSRAIILVPERSPTDAPLDARISTHCHETSGGGDRICYEEVILTVRGEAAAHLSGVVAPLLIHDLPTHVWWPGDPPFADPVFAQLVEMADRVVVDSSDFSDLLGGLRRLAGLRRRSGVGDLTWERLSWWQELTAQFFDAPRFRRYLPNLSRLWIRYATAVPA